MILGGVYPYLLRGLSITAPNQVWGMDITSIRLPRTWMCLVALLDWYSRYVVAWKLGDSMEEALVLAPVRRALSRVRPRILNSDQGRHFTANDYVTLVDEIKQLPLLGRRPNASSSDAPRPVPG